MADSEFPSHQHSVNAHLGLAQCRLFAESINTCCLAPDGAGTELQRRPGGARRAELKHREARAEPQLETPWRAELYDRTLRVTEKG